MSRVTKNTLSGIVTRMFLVALITCTAVTVFSFICLMYIQDKDARTVQKDRLRAFINAQRDLMTQQLVNRVELGSVNVDSSITIRFKNASAGIEVHLAGGDTFASTLESHGKARVEVIDSITFGRETIARIRATTLFVNDKRWLSIALVITSVFLMITLTVVFFGLLRFINRKVVVKINQLESYIDSVENYLSGECEHLVRINDLKINELNKIGGRLYQFGIELIQAISEKQKKEVDFQSEKARSEIANIVAHDIKSPLAALHMLTRQLSGLPSDKRHLLGIAVQRITDITNTLGKDYQHSRKGEADKSGYVGNTVHHLSSMVEYIVSEKRIQTRNKSNISIEFEIVESHYNLFVAVWPSEFMRMLSNIIGNAIEAVSERQNGRVIVDLQVHSEQEVILNIVDNGVGMSRTVLNNIGTKGMTTKLNGSGLGIYDAYRIIRECKGRVKYDSVEHHGTSVQIVLPLAKSPDWFVEHLNIEEGTSIYIFDDDESIHRVWDNRFVGLSVKTQRNNINTLRDAEKIVRDSFQENVKLLFLVDFEFIGEDNNGLQFIEQNGIQEKSILVTSRIEDDILMKAVQCGVKVIPKDMVSIVPVIQQKPVEVDAVLIDDDEIIHTVWQMSANANNKKIGLFFDVHSFIEKATLINSNTPVFIDEHLKEGLGHELAKQIYQNGFTDITITSGDSIVRENTWFWIKKTISKTPPWE